MKDPTRFTVFLSSTFKDLVEHRQKVIECLHRLRTGINAMEFFCASKDEPRTQCLKKVQESNLYVGIIGVRYGSVDPKTGLSYTEEEYNEAAKCGIDSLLFLIDEGCPLIRPQDIDYENYSKLNQFKARIVKEHSVDRFTTPDNLAMKVGTSIMQYIHSDDTLAAKHSIDPEIQEAMQPTSELTHHQLLRRFHLFPERWTGIRFNAILENFDCYGNVRPPCKTDDIEPSQEGVELVCLPWTIDDSEFHSITIFAEGELVYQLLDLESPARIECSLETLSYFSNQFSYHDSPDLGLKVVAIHAVKSVPQNQFSTPTVSTDIDLPF